MYLLCVLLWLSVAHGLRVAPGHCRPRALARPRALMSATSEAAAAEAAALEPTKKNLRRQIMTKSNYMRGGSPFEKSIHKDVSGKMSEMFAGELVEQMKQSSFRELVVAAAGCKRTADSSPRLQRKRRLPLGGHGAASARPAAPKVPGHASLPRGAASAGHRPEARVSRPQAAPRPSPQATHSALLTRADRHPGHPTPHSPGGRGVPLAEHLPSPRWARVTAS